MFLFRRQVCKTIFWVPLNLTFKNPDDVFCDPDIMETFFEISMSLRSGDSLALCHSD